LRARRSTLLARPRSISLGHPPSFLCLLCLLWPMNALDARHCLPGLGLSASVTASLDFPFSLPAFHLPRHRPFGTFPPATFAPFSSFSSLFRNFDLPQADSCQCVSFLEFQRVCVSAFLTALDARPSSLDFPFSLPVFHLPRHRRML
jgi:hypothetical protein